MTYSIDGFKAMPWLQLGDPGAGQYVGEVHQHKGYDHHRHIGVRRCQSTRLATTDRHRHCGPASMTTIT